METLTNDSWTKSQTLTTENAAEILNKGAQSKEDIVISGVTTATKVYYSSSFEKSGIKFSSKSEAGVLTFETTVDVTEITIEAMKWDQDPASYNVLDANSKIAGTYTFDSTGMKTETFKFTEPTSTITIEAANASECRFAFYGLTFTYTAE